MPSARPDKRALKRYFGATTYSRGLAYSKQGRVEAGGVSEDVVSGRVLGRRGFYQVAAVVSDGSLLAVNCSCPMMTDCKHGAALMLYLLQRPDEFEDVEPERGDWELVLFESDQHLKKWAQELNVEALLDNLVHDVFDYEGRFWTMARHATTLRALLLLDPERLPARDRRIVVSYQGGGQEWLKAIGEERRQISAYQERAKGWRAQAPSEPELKELWQRLVDRGEPGSAWDWELDAPPEPKGRVIADPPSLTLQDAEQVKLEGALPRDTPWGTISALLDLLTHPELKESPLRARVCKVLATPQWERTLKALDRALKLGEPQAEADEEGRELGWKLDVEALRLQMMLVRPYKTRTGLRSWRTSFSDAKGMMSPADRELYAMLQETSYTRAAHQLHFCHCVERLVGHPRVVGPKGAHLEVRRGNVEMAWSPLEQGGVRLELRVQGQAACKDELKALAESNAGGRSLLRRGELVYLVALDPAQASLVGVLAERESTFPTQAVESLMERVDAFSQVTPLRLEGSLKGEEVEGDPRPLLRLTPEREGGLKVQGLIRPLQGARAWPPGEGPSQVHRIQEGGREFVRRELDQELTLVRGVIQELGLGEELGPQSVELRLYDLELALELVQRLQEDSERYQIEWTRPRPKVSRPATANDLKLRGAKKRDWFGLSGGLEVDGVTMSLKELLAAVRDGRRYVAVGDSDWVELSEELRAQLSSLAALGTPRKEGVELPWLSSLSMVPLEEAGAQVELSRPLTLQLQRLKQAATLKVSVPKELDATLRPYQEDGFAWMARLAHWAPGAVLADDMGLGKTVQALCLLLRRAAGGPALVVAPASVGVNWQREAQRFAPSLKVQSYRGPQRAQLLSELGPGQVLVTSWELMTRDVEALAKVGLHTVVLDEAQAIKNHTTRRARASAELGADFVLSLTGTPVENRVGELWSLMRTTVPGLLGSAKGFRERVVLPIERDDNPEPRRALSQLIRPFLLRRLKSQVALDLPERSEGVMSVELSGSERALYDEFRLATIAALNAPPEPGQEKQQRFRILAAMTRLRQLACHPGLVHKHLREGGSTKLTHLVRKLQDLKAEGHRALVFSQFTTLLGLAREQLEQAGLEVCYLDGKTPLKKRQAQVDAFQGGQGDVFLISLKAGGTGLNLTAASYVFHLDPWWNPSVEDQATDRAHRIGQTQPVFVTRLVAVDTIEEQVLAMHAEKRGLVAELLAGTGKASALSTKELLTLLESGGEVELSHEPVASPAPEPVVPDAGSNPSPTNEATLARYQAHLTSAVEAGRLKASSANTYLRAAQRALEWVAEQGGEAGGDRQALMRWWAAAKEDGAPALPPAARAALKRMASAL